MVKATAQGTENFIKLFYYVFKKWCVVAIPPHLSRNEKATTRVHEDISREKHNWNFVLKLMKWKHSQYTVHTELVHKCVGKIEMSAFDASAITKTTT